ncbi:MAG: FAD-dependent oxidoreductase [Pseudomonadota bacterium]|nr:FAD-dependent oxidoreductase [Pseudomonadota bacterium]MEA3259533.1 FAD-dependent oxidoreductase [Pseudomonadota bacterium]
MADVLVVGGGIVGLLSALNLSDRGLSVTVIDAGGQRPPASWAGGGILSPLFAWRYPDPMNRLSHDATARYRALVDRLQGKAGLRASDLHDSGLWAAVDGDERRQALSWASAWGLSCQEAPLSRHLSTAPERHGVWFPDIGNLRNPRLLKALRATLVGQGVTFVNAAVNAVRPAARGAELTLSRGGTLSAPRVLLCAGAWTPALLAPLGVRLPLFPAKGEMLLYRLPPGRVPTIVLTDQGYLIPRTDGAVLAGSTLNPGDATTYPTVTGRWALQAMAASLLPELASVTPSHHWAGVRPGSDRDWPYLGSVPGTRGVFAAAGLHRNGLVAAPASAELLVRLVCGETPSLNSGDYSLSGAPS